MNNNDIVRNASVIMNHYERQWRHTEPRERGGRNLMHIVKKKNLFHNQVHTDNPSKKKTTLGPAGQTQSNNE